MNHSIAYVNERSTIKAIDWLIEIYLQTEGQGTHHKMVSLQPMPGFSPLLGWCKLKVRARVEIYTYIQILFFSNDFYFSFVRLNGLQ